MIYQSVEKIFRFSISLSLASFLFVLAGCGAPSFIKIAPESPATIISVDGKVLKSGKPVSKGAAIMPGETVLAEDGGAALIKIGDRAGLQMRSTSKLVFDEIADTISLNLDYGALMSVVARQSDRKFILKTPAVVAGVRGTAFYIESRAIDQTYICLCEGVLSLTSQDTVQEIRSRDRSHHSPYMVTQTPSGAVQVSGSSMINHTNADISALEDVIQKK